ncbi:MAG: VRR-NUC domain-containing protein [Acidobacteriota bacterium]
MIPSEPRPLPEGYYLDNFEAMLATVVERYGDLLTDPEKQFTTAFAHLSTGARRLYVRLISRKGPLFRRDRLAYREIPDLDAAMSELTGASFADDAPDSPAAERISLLLRREIEALAVVVLPPRAAVRACRLGKAELADRVLRGPEGEPQGADPALHLESGLERALATFPMLRLLRLAEVETLQLLFFGNFGQSLTEFVLRDMGLLRFEAYDFDRRFRLFPHRAALDDTLEARRRGQEIQDLLEAGEIAAAAERGREIVHRQPPWDAVARPRVDRLLVLLGRDLERRQLTDEALELYSAAHRPPARERAARILSRSDRQAEALDLCAAMIAAPRDETEAEVGPRIQHRILRRRREVGPAQRPRRPTTTLELPPPPVGVSIEAHVLEHLQGEGRRGFFAENRLWRSLFGLAFWDIVFSPVAGAFEHPFQYGPLDLSGPEFRAARRNAVERRLADLAAAPRHRLRRRLRAIVRKKWGIANRLVAWHPQLDEHLEFVLRRLSGRQLAAVCDRLSRGPGRYGRGLPDLFLADPRDPASAFELIEVKGPGDTLRPEQGRWLDYLTAHEVRASVLRLTWSEERTVACYDFAHRSQPVAGLFDGADDAPGPPPAASEKATS